MKSCCYTILWVFLMAVNAYTQDTSLPVDGGISPGMPLIGISSVGTSSLKFDTVKDDVLSLRAIEKILIPT